MDQTQPAGRHFGRRDFLRVGSLSFLGIHLSQFLGLQQAMAATGRLEKEKAQSCILLWLDGGPPQMDTWDPKPVSSFQAINTKADGIQIGELFPKTAQQMDKLSVIRSMHTQENNHLLAHHEVFTGHRPNPAMRFPSLGAIVSKELGPRTHLPPHVLFPSMGKARENCLKAHFLGAAYDPMTIPNPNGGGSGVGKVSESIQGFEVPDLSIPKSMSPERIQTRLGFLNKIDHVYREKVDRAAYGSMDEFRQQAWNMILSPAVREAFDLSKEPPKLVEAYGDNAFGQSVLMSRRLVEAGARFVTAAGYNFQSWDTHSTHDPAMKNVLGPSLDRALATLVEDLDQRGLLESTIVVVMGEFGRTSDVNPNGGRDHWCYCWSMLLGGGGIKGGQVVGASDSRGAYPAERPVSLGDAYATIYKAMGIDWRKEIMHPIGRPLKIANAIDDQTGTPLPELI